MIACPSCARENPDQFAFCPACGTRLAAPEPPPAGEARALTEQRKVVSILFCDLVGYTSHSEAADHELIDTLLQRYGALARRLVEGHGGVVEKFIGDAVLAVFGLLAAHDDDAERAVRCALRLAADAAELTWPDGDPVEVRIGVNSGETYLHTDVEPSSGGTFLTGDAVNTAARLEAAAPPGGVVVGELTHTLTASAVTYEEMAPLVLKGKREPVKAWRAREATNRTGLRTSGSADTLFVGRGRQLQCLREAFERACGSGEAHSVLLVGEPGIGKSRLVLEFGRRLDHLPLLITWRQGRCVAYGEGATFGALADIVKAHAGVLENDDVTTVEAKLDGALPRGRDRPWIRERLRALLGLPAAQAEREENFAAWSAFLGTLADAGPLVLVFEDVHWADDALLAFVEHLVRQRSIGPLLVIATTRPEVVRRHPDLLDMGERSRRIAIQPLARHDAGRLVSALLDDRLAADVRWPLLERAGGNPLFAEEYVRLLLDRDLLVRRRGVMRVRGDAPLPLPDTIQAVLAARLDTLRPTELEVLCDAAVLGETFWRGGIAALQHRDESEVDDALVALTRRELIRRATGTALSGERAFTFWHALARDAAYNRLPMKTRVRRHVDAASWIEGRAGPLLDNLAEAIAHHWVTALELATSLKDEQDAAAFAPRAGHFLWLAGQHAFRIDLDTSRRHLSRAIGLLPEGADMGHALHVYARALCLGGDPREGLGAFERAALLLEAEGDANGSGSCRIERAMWRGSMGQRSEEEFERAVESLDFDHPTPDLVHALTETAAARYTGSMDYYGCLSDAERALEVAERLGLPTPPAAEVWRGAARARLREEGWLEDIRSGLEHAEAQGLGGDLARLYATYEVAVANELGPAAGMEAARECVEFARRHGMEYWVSHEQCDVVLGLACTGQWDEALREGKTLDGQLVEKGWQDALEVLRPAVADIQLARGETAGLGESADWLEAVGRDAGTPDFRATFLLVAAAGLRRAAGRDDDARDLLAVCLARYGSSVMLAPAVRLALELGGIDTAERFIAGATILARDDEYALESAAALVAEANGRHDEAEAGFGAAASQWGSFGVPYEQALALLGRGRCLLALGRTAEAIPALAQAREILARLGAKPALEETGMLLSRARE